MPASLNKSRVGGHFDPTRLPAARAFFEAEGVIRPGDRPDRRGNIKGDCIAHPSKSHKSCAYRLNGQIYCYGCGFHGDLIDFVKLRHRVHFRTAAKILGAWRDSPLTQQERTKLNHRASVQQQEREQAIQAEKAQRKERLNLRVEIHEDAQLMKEISLKLRDDVENETLWECLELVWKCRELTEREYMHACGPEADS
jgi:hypothetical protein